MKHECNLETYTAFLIANGNRYSGVEVSKAMSGSAHAPAHDAISRWLTKQTCEPHDLWKRVRSNHQKSEDLHLIL